MMELNDETHTLFLHYTWQPGLNPLGRRFFLGNLISTMSWGQKEGGRVVEGGRVRGGSGNTDMGNSL